MVEPIMINNNWFKYRDVIIGNNVIIGHGSIIYPNVVVGDNTSIGPYSTLLALSTMKIQLV